MNLANKPISNRSCRGLPTRTCNCARTAPSRSGCSTGSIIAACAAQSCAIGAPNSCRLRLPVSSHVSSWPCDNAYQIYSAPKGQLTDPHAFVKANSVYGAAGLVNGSAEFKLKRSDSVTSVNSYFFKASSNDSGKKPNETPSQSDLEQIYLRLCLNCSAVLEKKYKTLKDKLMKSKFTECYNVASDS